MGWRDQTIYIYIYIYIYRSKGFDESYSKMYLLLNLSNCVKSYGHLCQIYHEQSPNMVTSRDPGFKFRIFYFLPNSILNFRKVTKFGGNWLKNKKLQAKNKTRGGKHSPPQCLSG